MLRPSYNYSHYISQRPRKKILKQSLYNMLDYPLVLQRELEMYNEKEKKRQEKVKEFFDNLGWRTA